MVSGDGGNTKLAFAEGDAQGWRPPIGYHQVAFRVDGPSFLQSLDKLEQGTVYDEEGRETSSGRVVDHEKAD